MILETYKSKSHCWEWGGNMRGVIGKQVGVLTFNGKRVSAHRVAWIVKNGEIPKGMHICHVCDNHKCINPSHLFLGTNRDNMKDKVLKGRQSKGEHRPTSKLKEWEVIKIRKLAEMGVMQTRLARDFHVSSTTIFRVVHRHLWTHLK